MTDKERNQCISAQARRCADIGIWLLMPSDGRCFSCGKDIMQRVIDLGKDFRRDLITGCPYCSSSFC